MGPDVFETLALPDGVSLVHDLSVQATDDASLRARLVVPEGVESRLRLEGKRVYLDLAWPKAPWMIGGAGQAGRAGRAGETVRRPGAVERATLETDPASGADLAAVQASGARGNATAARNQLNAFINQVQALQHTGRLDAATAQMLIREAQAVIANL